MAWLSSICTFVPVSGKWYKITSIRTLLQVRVARLKLKLREAELERAKALRAAHVSHALAQVSVRTFVPGKQ